MGVLPSSWKLKPQLPSAEAAVGMVSSAAEGEVSFPMMPPRKKAAAKSRQSPKVFFIVWREGIVIRIQSP